jgi:hypothetical protein
MRKTILAVSVAAALLVSTGPALACCGDGKAAAAGAEAAGYMVSGAIESAKLTVVAWLERLNTTITIGFGKVMAEIQRQTASLRTMEEGNAAVLSQLHMERARAEAATRYEPSPRLCFEASGGAASGVAGAGVDQTWRGLNDKAAARTLFTPNTSAAVARIYDDHASKYCSQQDADFGRCSAVDPKLQNADVRADVVLNTSSYTPEQIAAAQAFVTNVANPVPTQNIPASWEKTPQGKTFVAGQYIEQARSSVAANSLNAAVAARTPIQGLGTAAMLNKADVSEQELFESQVRGRFESPAWYKMIAGFSLENMMREVVKIRALQARMDLAEYRRTERVEAVLATQLAMDVKRDSEQRIRELRTAAAKAGQ